MAPSLLRLLFSALSPFPGVYSRHSKESLGGVELGRWLFRSLSRLRLVSALRSALSDIPPTPSPGERSGDSFDFFDSFDFGFWILDQEPELERKL
jgi:hypothetical protein